MNNFPVWILLVLAAGLSLFLVLSGGLSQRPAEPEIINLDSIAHELSPDRTTGRSLFNAESATFAFLRQIGATSPHVHHESNEVVFVLNGTGMAYAGENEYELVPGSVLIFFAESPVMFEQTSDEPLDLLVLLTPPSHDENVTRFANQNELFEATQGSLSPQLSSLSSYYHDELEGESIALETIALFRPTGRIDTATIDGKYTLAKSDQTKRAIYVVAGSGSLKWGRGLEGTTEHEIQEGDFINLPQGRNYELKPTSRLQIIQFATPDAGLFYFTFMPPSKLEEFLKGLNKPFHIRTNTVQE